MKKELICILCPRGCRLTATEYDGVFKVTGNACPRGEKYAESECKAPMRTVTAVVRVVNREDCMVSVKTEAPVPKEKMFEVIKIINSKKIAAPVEIGEIICDNVYGTKVVATKSIP